MNYQEALDYLETLPDMERARHGSGISMSIDSMKALLNLLGNPEKKAKTIHITGSKGKGSTATMIASILDAAGYHTALFTSPHLHSYRERMTFDLTPVDESDFAWGIGQIAEVLRDEKARSLVGPISTFGILTALFFLLVAMRNPEVDWQIVEVGLGGRHDATNVFSQKELAVITPINLEHTALLGNSTTSIAQHKAGIITPGTSVVLARQSDPSVKEVVAAACRANGATFIDVAARFDCKRTCFGLEEQSFRLEEQCRDRALKGEYRMQLRGQHQIENALTALVAINTLSESGYKIDEEAKSEGLLNAKLAGRFEVFSGTLKNRAVVFDGAHNAGSARALSQALEDYFPDRKCIFILALNSDKCIEEFWLELNEQSAAVIATRADNPRALPPETLAERIKSCDSSANVFLAPTFRQAIDNVRELAASIDGDNKPICVTGSLYLVAEARLLFLR